MDYQDQGGMITGNLGFDTVDGDITSSFIKMQSNYWLSPPFNFIKKPKDLPPKSLNKLDT